MREPTVWTASRVFQLMTLVEHGRSDDQIANRLGSTVHAVRQARHKHGIPPVTATAHTCASAGRLMGLCEKIIRSWILNGWLEAKRLRLRRGGNRQWMITEYALYSFLERTEHWHRWHPERITDPDLRDWATSMRAGVQFLTLTEAARIACVQPKTVSDWIRKGWLPALRNGNHTVRESDLLGLLARRNSPVVA